MLDFILAHPILMMVTGIAGACLLMIGATSSSALHPAIPVGVVGFLAIAFSAVALDRPSMFPEDVKWHAGTITALAERSDGDLVVTMDGRTQVVISGDPDLAEGDPLYLLHARRTPEIERTFLCTRRDRDHCHAVSLVLDPPFGAVTANQGTVAPGQAHQ